jgi:translation initiation factor IF-3
MKKKNIKKEQNYRVGKKISQWGKVEEVRIVGENYNNIYSLDGALKLAEKEGLDLVEINPNSNPPTCKILDFDKFMFDKKKKQKEIDKRNNKNKQEVKEMRFGPNTDEHDLEFKKKHIIKFLKNNDKVKAYVFFKGREMSFKEKGEILLLKLANELSDLCKVDSMPKLEGNKLIMILSPKK